MIAAALAPVARYCGGCGRERQEGEYGCPTCGADVYTDEVPAGVLPVETLPGGALRGVLGQVLADVVPPAVIALHGRRGIGKTTLAFAALERPYIVTSEMAPGLVAVYCHRLRVTHAGIGEPWLDTSEAVARVVFPAGAERGAELVLDSANECGDVVAAVSAAKAWARRHTGIAIVVFQHTKDGQPAGAAAALHACDVEVLVDQVDGDRVVEVQKSRFGSTGSAVFALGAHGPELPARDRYYSVEGAVGAYRLVPWPSPRSGPGAAFLRWAEAELQRDRDAGQPPGVPDPPVAVGAARSLLAPSGWIEPPDVAERAAFARAHGVPYWSPVSRQEVR